MTKTTLKSIDINKKVIAKDIELANKLRAEFDRYNIHAIDVLGTIGAGKTTLLERITERFASKIPILVINGDLATNIDADRIAMHGATSIQINTGQGCHLNAKWTERAIANLPNGLKPFKNGFVFIENVGNLICPAGWDVGAHRRMVVTSVTEGPFHIKKHPYIFKIASIAVINKIETAELMDVDLNKLKEDAFELNQNIKVFFTSLKREPYTGLDPLLNELNLKI